MVFGIAPLASALTVRLSFDGVNPAPDEVDALVGQVFAIYVISDSDGVSYTKNFGGTWDDEAAITNTQSYPAAGDLASISTTTFTLTAEDSGGNIQAGKHFSFDLAMTPDVGLGSTEYFYLWSGPDPDDTIAFNIIPEPGTLLLLGLGGLAFLRRPRCSK